MSTFPVPRLRRLRRTGALRSLVRETRLDLADFVLPVFVAPEPLRNEALPALTRFTVDELVAEAEECAALGLSALLLFGLPEEKDERGSGAWDDDGIVQRALRGVLDGEEVANDETLELLGRTAVSHVEAGADAVAPSDMMDGRVAALRTALDDAGYESAPIVSYAAKYASAFYGPFREAADSAPAF